MDEFNIQDLIDRAFAALHGGDYVRAVGIADQLAAEAPGRAVVHAIRAHALLGSDSPEESFQEARQAVDLDPNDGHARRLLAMTAWRTGRISLAQESFERAIELSDHRPALLSDYAWFMASERGPKPAEEAARTAIEADAGSSTAWAALGLAQHRLHRHHDAETSLRRALALDPKDLYAQSAMLTFLQSHSKDAKAEALADLLAEHAGTEELVAAVHDEAKQRQIARMLVERKVDLGGLDMEPRRYRWIWLLAAAAFLCLIFGILGLRYLYIIAAVAFLLLFAMRRAMD
jgi:Tfp pilus assembly protein PilF